MDSKQDHKNLAKRAGQSSRRWRPGKTKICKLKITKVIFKFKMDMAIQGAKSPTKEYLIYHCQPEAKTTIKMGTKNTLEVKREKGM